MLDLDADQKEIDLANDDITQMVPRTDQANNDFLLEHAKLTARTAGYTMNKRDAKSGWVVLETEGDGMGRDRYR